MDIDGYHHSGMITEMLGRLPPYGSPILLAITVLTVLGAFHGFRLPVAW